MRFLGLDLGGSSVRAVVCDEAGTVLGHGRAAGGNIRSSVGLPEQNVAAAVGACMVRDIDAVAVGAAGAGAARRAEVVDVIERGLRIAHIDVVPTVVPDLDIAFRAVSPSPHGRLLLSGTGAIAARYDGWEIAERCDGMGWLLGDTGSGAWLGREILRAAAADLDHRGPGTALTAAVCAHYRLPTTGDPRQHLIRAIDGTRAAEWARLAPLLRACPGDAVATRILDEAADALLVAVRAVGEGDVVLAGGSLGPGPLRDRLEAELGPCPHAAHPVVGACALAAGKAGVELDRAALLANLA